MEHLPYVEVGEGNDGLAVDDLHVQGDERRTRIGIRCRHARHAPEQGFRRSVPPRSAIAGRWGPSHTVSDWPTRLMRWTTNASPARVTRRHTHPGAASQHTGASSKDTSMSALYAPTYEAVTSTMLGSTRISSFSTRKSYQLASMSRVSSSAGMLRT